MECLLGRAGREFVQNLCWANFSKLPAKAVLMLRLQCKSDLGSSLYPVQTRKTCAVYLQQGRATLEVNSLSFLKSAILKLANIGSDMVAYS